MERLALQARMRSYAVRAMGTSTLLMGMGLSAGCVEDPDCGICDPSRLVLESLTGVNYAGETIHVRMPGVTGAKYFVEPVGDCELTDAATGDDALRGSAEWCRLSPLITWGGLELVFNNLLEPTSVEHVRKKPDDPSQWEVYDWKTQILQLEGPITRYNGDVVLGDNTGPTQLTRLKNLTCIENVPAFDHTTDPAVCDGLRETPVGTRPVRMDVNGVMGSYRGQTDSRARACTTPEEGPDTCCNVCDFELSVNVAKYGLRRPAAPETLDLPRSEFRSFEDAIVCDPLGDPLQECREFIPYVERKGEVQTHAYDWPGSANRTWRLPRQDLLRQTHPTDRPDGLEHANVRCNDDEDCRNAGLDSTQCMGFDDGEACTEGEDCEEKFCRAAFFGTCAVDFNTYTVDSETDGRCVDQRYSDRGAAACFQTTSTFESCNPEDPTECTNIDAGERLAKCDANHDNLAKRGECCQASLGSDATVVDPVTGSIVCDPLHQPNVGPIIRFDRSDELPHDITQCYCGDPDDQDRDCASPIAQFCTPPWGNRERHDGRSNEGEYLTRFVTREGGVIYDPALKGIQWRPGDLGQTRRALVEQCAEHPANGLIEPWTLQDGWIAHTEQFSELNADYDLALCSGSTYEVVFASEGEVLKDKVGNRLDEGRNRYAFSTPEFHVVPGSGFPTDNLRIGACDEFELSFSNKYDMSPRNLRKLEIWELEPVDDGCVGELTPECWQPRRKVAGGPDCTQNNAEVMASGGAAVPCLEVDPEDQADGTIRVRIDPVRFGRQLYVAEDRDPWGTVTTGRYRLLVPALGYDGSGHNPGVGAGGFGSLDEFLEADGHPNAYARAFHDACGMPLITQGADDHHYDFSIDPPKCRDDKDNDGVPRSCDNDANLYNPDQLDTDHDGIGDAVDKCPTVYATSVAGDSDGDGTGNACDNCREQPFHYNIEDVLLPSQARYWVRANPEQRDTDHDGIGDVCDNCPTVPNCRDFGPDNPWSPGHEGPGNGCQEDLDEDMIGDACTGLVSEGAAGPVGYLETDDFDQDGLANAIDRCPRLVASRSSCIVDDDCAGGAPQCVDGRCNHPDADDDGVGDRCDTCRFVSNPLQVTDMGMQLDDDDGDFVGVVCESTSGCEDRRDPRPFSFHHVAVDGLCCTTQWGRDGEYVESVDEDGTVFWDCVGRCDPDGLPIRRDCDPANDPENPEDRIPDGVKCRRLPLSVQAPNNYGLVDLPPGCAAALAEAGMCDPGDPECPWEDANRRLTTADIPDRDDLWDTRCTLPQRDQDMDGLGDACDLCPFAYDPFNVQLMEGWQHFQTGLYCSGEYESDTCEIDPPEDEDTTEETEGTASGTED